MVFRVVDFRKQGKVDEDGLISVLRNLGKEPDKRKVDIIFKACDRNQSGFIEGDEFVNYMIHKQQLKVSGPEKRQKTGHEEHQKDQHDQKQGEKTQKQGHEDEGEKQTENKGHVDNQASNSEVTLGRGLKISDFYTAYAGQHDEFSSEEKDIHHNPKGHQYDLGHESAFGMFSVLMFNFNDKDPGIDPQTLFEQPKKSLQAKGLKVHVAANIEEFLKSLHDYDECWFSCSKYDNLGPDKDRFIQEIDRFHTEGKGIAIWADNSPFHFQANLVLPKLVGTVLEGKTAGGKILKLSNEPLVPSKGTFIRHLITTGILNLYEGDTICYPSSLTKEMEVIGMSSDGFPCFFVAQPENKGRILVDCGFTKLYPKFWDKTAGTERFVRNAAVWLLGLDWRLKLGYPVKGNIHHKSAKK
eukprot:TRINITY_DN6825_c0_g1_i1.p1 TRINITY_DN6825_c0_g1~~TRINITY_DN6825_c0_g1_i1.p1  ORF type:complete len:412 (+),score=85.55 TRINITY_DN6825_c0_g1_i1:219-1454(+)